jgi:peptide deformylase
VIGEYAGMGDWSPAALGVAGRVRPVVTAPDPVLSRAGADVDPTADVVVRLAADLVATMRASPGCVGLAAPQVGVGARVFAVDVTGHPKAVTVHGTFVFCNAEVVEASRWRPGREGCMSVPDLTGDVKRASRLVVTASKRGHCSTKSTIVRACYFLTGWPARTRCTNARSTCDRPRMGVPGGSFRARRPRRVAGVRRVCPDTVRTSCV